jgi:hypothetical protein
VVGGAMGVILVLCGVLDFLGFNSSAVRLKQDEVPQKAGSNTFYHSESGAHQ